MSSANLSIAEASKAIASGELSAKQLTEDVLQRASLTESQLHSFMLIDHDGARASAEQADAKLASGSAGSLAGIPIALKDNMVTEGIETTCSSKILEGWIPPYDGSLSQAMKAADAVVVDPPGPASDPQSWVPGHAGPPPRDPEHCCSPHQSF